MAKTSRRNKDLHMIARRYFNQERDIRVLQIAVVMLIERTKSLEVAMQNGHRRVKSEGEYKNNYNVDEVIRTHPGWSNTDIGKILGVSHQWVTAYKLFHDGWKQDEAERGEQT